MRVFRRRLQRQQIDDVHDANPQIGNLAPQEIDGRQRLERRHVAAARHHDVGIGVVVVARPRPDPGALGAVLDRRVHVEPLRRGLLAGDDHVDVIARPQAVIDGREQRVRVGRQVDAHDVGLLVHDVIDEPGILMAEARCGPAATRAR